MEVSLKKSSRKGKKLMLIFYDNKKKVKTIHFGSSANKDFTIYSKEGKKIAEEKKKLYLARHSPKKTKENWSIPDTPASASRWILWNKPTIQQSYKDYLKRFKLKNL
jgi:hypothetical protein